ncbi:hypothetical protein HDV02_004943 [Globomyces sp. JEL0801]|nr:hypothetical protein HDV02_004943 [Globomyces sp. JEL0801]
MDSYPKEYISHHVPLLGVLGLAQELKQTDSITQEKRRVIDNSISVNLIATLRNINNSYTIWDSKRCFQLLIIDENFIWPKKLAEKQSLLSPSNLASNLFPNGIFSPSWIQRHREIIPSVVVLFRYLWESIDKDPLGMATVSGLERDHDSILISEINKLKQNDFQANSKFVVVFILKNSRADSPLIEERLTYIRKQCGLTGQYVMTSLNPDGSLQDVTKQLESIHKQLLEVSNNYYKEKEKKIKKKKAKLLSSLSKPAPLIIGSKVLSPRGWVIRYDLKMAIYCEFRKDFENAIKSYEAAYSNLYEMLLDSNGVSNDAKEIDYLSDRWFEARQLLDSIVIKVMQILLQNNAPVDALYHHQRHILSCKPFSEFAYISLNSEPYGPVSVSGLNHISSAVGGGSFSYWQWVSLQYRIFGELIEIASIKKAKFPLPFPVPGSTANPALSLINTVATTSTNWMGNSGTSAFGPYSSINPMFTVQHPGYYYLCSARAAEERWKRFIRSTISQSDFFLPNDKLTNHFNSLVTKDQAFDHGSLIIELLTKSYEQFKKYKCSRMTLYLASEIARVYQESNQFDMALKFYDRIAKTYRKESWYSLLSTISNRMRYCASQLKYRQVEAECLIELLHPSVTPSSDDLTRLIRELQMFENDTEVPIEIDMDAFSQFFTCDFQFKANHGQVLQDQFWQLTLKTSSNSLQIADLSVQKLTLHFTDSNFDYHILNDLSDLSGEGRVLYDCKSTPNTSDLVGNVYSAPIQFKPNQIAVYQGFLLPTEHQKLSLAKVSVELNLPSKISLVFKLAVRPERFHKRKWLEKANVESPNKYIELPGLGEQIEQREPKVEIVTEFQAQGYIDEYIKLDFHVVNNEAEDVQLIAVFQCVSDSENLVTDQSCMFQKLPGTAEESLSVFHINVGTLKPGDKVSDSLYFQCQHRLDSRSIVSSVYISIASNPANINQVSSFTYDLSDTKLLWKIGNRNPIKVESLFECNTKFEAIACPAFESTAIGGSVLKFNPDYKATKILQSLVHVTIRLVIWHPSNSEAFIYKLRLNIDVFASNLSVEYGKLEIIWSRNQADEAVTTTSILDLPRYEVVPELLRVFAKIPGNIVVGKPFDVTYTIQNLTLHLAELLSLVESSEHFVFSGYKQIGCRILPYGTQLLKMKFLPLSVGRCALPQLRIMKRSDMTILEEAETDLNRKEGDNDKCFPISVASGHIVGSKKGELYVNVNPV